ncbi:flavodoxin family protein [Rhodococcus sp. NPDC127530]|uniref:flavodoxin family protein n=1 Tax=unclassified Rhodococcus (in: high G+C Gram-positive bacteria) TaxID=192944 RepID=UPI00362A9CE8
MRTLVVYESMFGNTRHVADAIARGLASAGTVSTVPVTRADDEDLSGYDLVVVGGPTHVHGMSRASTRRGAVDTARTQDVTLEPDAASEGVREWLGALPRTHGKAAAFDTRADGPVLLTGRASKGIGRKLRRLGFELVAESESFLVDKESRLEEGEAVRAERWGRMLAQRAGSTRAETPSALDE